MRTASTGFAHDFELYNDTNEEFYVEVRVWVYPPCPGDDPNDVFSICIDPNDVTYMAAPPQKFIKLTKISCVCSITAHVGSTHCLGGGDAFVCGSTRYIAGNSEREFRIEYD